MELLYQDSQIVLCVKPVGLSSESGPGSLPSLLEAQLGAAVYPVHRLDLNVGGVMVYARTRQAAAALSQAVQAGHLQKEYLALVHGRPHPSAGAWEDLLWKDSGKNKVFVVRRMRKGVKAASLSYRVLETREALTWVQFASRGFPLVGDHKYGSRDEAKSPALWSFRLTLPHPVAGHTITCSHRPEGMPWQSFPSISREIFPWAEDC